MKIGHFNLIGPEFNPKKKYNIYMKYQLVQYKQCSHQHCMKKHYKSNTYDYSTMTLCRKCQNQLFPESINEKLIIEITMPYRNIINISELGAMLCSPRLIQKRDRYGRYKYFGMTDKPVLKILYPINVKYRIFQVFENID